MGSRRGDDPLQNVDDLVSPHSVVHGHEGKDSDLMSTMPFEDTVFLYDNDDDGTVLLNGNAHEAQMETQAMDLVGDTQLVDFEGETQVVEFNGETRTLDFDGETQTLDFEGEFLQLDDIDCNENIGTQVLSNYDDEFPNDRGCEESESTQTLGDNDYKLDDEAILGTEQFLDQEKVHFTSYCELNEKDVKQVHNALTNENSHSEPHVPASSPIIQGPSAISKSGPLRFTLIRASSLRASGLAVRNMNRDKTIHAGSSILTQKHALKSLSVVTDGVCFKEDPSKHDINEDPSKLDINEKCDHGICHENGSRLNENKLRAGTSIARKLFTENTCSHDLQDLHNERNTRKENLLELPSFDCQVTGLSYVDSQEPGEFSQSNALDFVDKFIQTSIKEFDMDIDHGKGSREKAKSSYKTNGPLSLAKNVKDKSCVEKSRVFDWDDSREDEGGGEIFCRRKEDFFDLDVVQASCTEPWKLSLGMSNGYRNRCHSDSKLESCALKPSKKYAPLSKGKTRKNLIKELDEELKINECNLGLVNNITEKDVESISYVGFDTQVAAEAMEALCQGDVYEFPIGNAHNCLQTASKDSLIGSVRKATDSLIPNHNTPCKRNSAADVEFVFEDPKKRKISSKLEEELSKSSRSNNTMNQSVQEGMDKFVPIARRTRRSLIVNQMVDADNAWGDDEPTAHGTRKHRIGKSKKLSKADAKIQKSKSVLNHTKELRNGELSPHRQPNQKSITQTDGNDDIDLLSSLRGRRPDHNLSRKFTSSNSNGTTRPRTRRSSAITHNDHSKCNKTPPINYVFPVFTEHDEVRLGDRKSDVGLMSSTQNLNCEDSPEKRCEPSNALSATPDNCKIPVNDASPVCMGEDYYNKYFKKNTSKPRMIQEIRSLIAADPLLSSTPKTSRKRKDTTGIRVLYSHHLNDNIVNQQKKILSRLGISTALSITDATHFIADEFVRTRNMLEAIALSKPVVTHSWIENCGQANCFIDEKNHILRDTKKEREFGFCMPLSLSRAAKHSLLKGQRVFITENTKPGKEILSSLVKAVEGQAVERFGRSALKNDKIPEDLLVLSCEEDYEICVPFIEKGAAIYSSELLLNGIVIQKLEFERHLLFTDHVKRTRSTTWLKKDGNKFLRVAKSQ